MSMVKAQAYQLDLHAKRETNPVLSQTYGRHILLQKAHMQQYQAIPHTARARQGSPLHQRSNSTGNNDGSQSAREWTEHDDARVPVKGMLLEHILEQRQKAHDDLAQLQLASPSTTPPIVEELEEMLRRIPAHTVKRFIASKTPADTEGDDHMPLRDCRDTSTDTAVSWLRKQEYFTRKGRVLERDKAAFLALHMKALSMELSRAINSFDDARDLEARLLVQKQMQLQATMRDTVASIAQLKAKRAHGVPVLMSDVDDCRSHIDSTEEAILHVQSKHAERVEELLRLERNLQRDLTSFETKMGSWDSHNQAKVVGTRVLNRAQSLLRRNGLVSVTGDRNNDEQVPECQDDANRVRALDALILQTGQGCGGWDATDHAAFVSALRHLGWTDGTLTARLQTHEEGLDALQVEAVVRRCASSGVLVGKSSDSVRTHLEWYFSHMKLVDEKRRAIAKWKGRRQEQRRASGVSSAQAPVVVDDAPNERRVHELADTKAQVRAWRAERRVQQQQQASQGSSSNQLTSSSALDALKRLETKQKVALYKLQKEEDLARQQAAAELVRKATLARQPSKKQLDATSDAAIAMAKVKLDKVQSQQAAIQQAATLPQRPKLPLFVPKESTVTQPTKASAARGTTPNELQAQATARHTSGAHAAYVPGLAGAGHVKGKSFGHVSSQPRAVPTWRRRG